ncbi:MAG: Uma2 family endonuclease [Taibaiella sp.]|nr:Uma2 family endonuclease [Taibaiella sp.]
MYNLDDLDINKLYTYADYYSWQFEERVELIKGRVFRMGPTPNYFHQSIAGELYGLLRNFLKGHPCKAMIAPFDVRLPRKSKEDKDIVTVLQPDVCVVCDPSKFDYRGCIGAPDIVVEILSPGNNAKELRNKFEVYEEAGVKEYWVISPQDNTFLMNTLVDGRYVTSRQMAAGDIVTTTVLPGFTIDLKELFDAAKI